DPAHQRGVYRGRPEDQHGRHPPRRRRARSSEPRDISSAADRFHVWNFTAIASGVLMPPTLSKAVVDASNAARDNFLRKLDPGAFAPAPPPAAAGPGAGPPPPPGAGAGPPPPPGPLAPGGDRRACSIRASTATVS